jgi:competence transcription factor ComK
MLIQLTKDFFVNTEQINYIKEFKDFGDGKEKTCIVFINKDSVCLPITINELTEVINNYCSTEED